MAGTKPLPALCALVIVCISITPALQSGAAQELTELQKQDLAVREACKVKICAAIHGRRPGPDIACNVAKSWPKAEIEKLVSKARVPWPWGDIRCAGEVKLERERLIAAVSEPRSETVFGKHAISCRIEREAEKTDITIEFAPKVAFENGKATKASMNWGKIEAPAAVRSALWTATATDNALNVLQSTLVQDINEFIGAKCEAVRSEWEGK